MYSSQDDIEKRISPLNLAGLLLDGGIPIEIPSAPQGTLNVSAGNLSAGLYSYRVTFVYPSGEGYESPSSTGVTIVTPGVAGKIDLSSIPVSTKGATSRKIYRTTAGGSTWKFLATIADNSTTTYTDNITDASLGSSTPANAILTAMISRADAEVNAFAGQVYTVPFTTTPAIVNNISIDLTCYYTINRRFATINMPDQWKQIYTQTKDLLQKIADEQLDLLVTDDVIDSPEIAITALDQKFSFDDPTSLMSDF